MNSAVEVLKPMGVLRDPILVSGMRVRRRGGRTAVLAITHLCEQWDGELVAKVSADDFYDLTVYRPSGRYVHSSRVIDWPEGDLYLAHPSGSPRDILLLVGNEPSFHWRAFAEAIMDFARNVGIKTLINLRSLPAYIPHTRPVPLSLVTSDPALERQFGMRSDKRIGDGPTDITGVLAISAQTQGWNTADLTCLQPDYFPRRPSSEAARTLIEALDRALGTRTDVAALDEAVIADGIAIQDVIRGDSTLAAAIRQLEQAYDANPPRPATNIEGELPSAQEVLNEVRRMLDEGSRH